VFWSSDDVARFAAGAVLLSFVCILFFVIRFLPLKRIPNNLLLCRSGCW
jgi:hypothetical protein